MEFNNYIPVKNCKDLKFEQLQEGMIIEGTVKNIKKFGAFIEINDNITGFLRIDDISISRIRNPNERLKIGQNIKIMVKSLENQNKRVNLTYKELLGNWEDNISKFKEKTITKGIIKEADKYKNGLFIELTPNLVGMAEYKEGFEYGQEVDVYIKRIISDKKKIKLDIVNK